MISKSGILGSGSCLAGLGGVGCLVSLCRGPVEIAGDVPFEAAAGFAGSFSLTGALATETRTTLSGADDVSP